MQQEDLELEQSENDERANVMTPIYPNSASSNANSELYIENDSENIIETDSEIDSLSENNSELTLKMTPLLETRISKKSFKNG